MNSLICTLMNHRPKRRRAAALQRRSGMRQIFPEVREAVARVIDPAKLRWISFSHFEADECGSLNEWLATAQQATAVCSFVGANVSVNDFANRSARAMQNNEVLATGKYRFHHFSFVTWNRG